MSTFGRIWRFGDDIDTDALAPGAYMKGSLDDLAAHCLETVNPSFAAEVEPGDLLVAGKNFGMGSSREQGAEALKHLGVTAVIARSFAGIFYRNSINVGLPVLTGEVPEKFSDGAFASVDVLGATLTFCEGGEVIQCDPLPELLLAILNDGGLVPHLENRFKRSTEPA